MPDADRTTAELLEETAASLHGVVVELAGRLQPFPSFMGMITLQAIELEPPPESRNDWGCVVVLPDGEICEMELGVIPVRSAPPTWTRSTATGRWSWRPTTTSTSPPAPYAKWRGSWNAAARRRIGCASVSVS